MITYNHQPGRHERSGLTELMANMCAYNAFKTYSSSGRVGVLLLCETFGGYSHRATALALDHLLT